jgi:hypothetical protein
LYGYVYNPAACIDPWGLDSWSDILVALGIPQPLGLTNPHSHHIVFKGVFNDIRGIPVRNSQAILQRFNIDVINDTSNLMWASNIKDVHTAINAQKIYDRLSAVEKELTLQLDQGVITPAQAQASMKEELQRAGQDTFSCY